MRYICHHCVMVSVSCSLGLESSSTPCSFLLWSCLSSLSCFCLKPALIPFPQSQVDLPLLRVLCASLLGLLPTVASEASLGRCLGSLELYLSCPPAENKAESSSFPAFRNLGVNLEMLSPPPDRACERAHSGGLE